MRMQAFKNTNTSKSNLNDRPFLQMFQRLIVISLPTAGFCKKFTRRYSIAFSKTMASQWDQTTMVYFLAYAQFDPRTVTTDELFYSVRTAEFVHVYSWFCSPWVIYVVYIGSCLHMWWTHSNTINFASVCDFLKCSSRYDYSILNIRSRKLQ